MADTTTYQISSQGRLLCLSVAGTLTLEEIWRLEDAFWSVHLKHDRMLMDFSGVSRVTVSVPEFIQVGIARQAAIDHSGERPGKRMMAAYVAATPNVYAFMRIIEEVWSAHLEINTFGSVDRALHWLGYGAETLALTQIEKVG